MTFTALHRLLGHEAGPVTDDLIDSAVAQHLAETDDLDWKAKLPAQKEITKSDFAKDAAAMANSGGGTIVYGVKEEQKRASERCDAGTFDEGYERTLLQVAFSGIRPPLFGIEFFALGADKCRTVVVVFPPATDGPHLIYNNDYFGAPIRNGAETVWMKERQIEAMYRARFDERRHAAEALDNIYAEMVAGRDFRKHAWLIAVAKPRLPATSAPPDRTEASNMLNDARAHALDFAKNNAEHPITNINFADPRPGLRRWNAVPLALGSDWLWKEARVAIHNDGTVVLATAIGGYPHLRENQTGNQILPDRIEACIADFMALVRVAGHRFGTSEYEVRVGIEGNRNSGILIGTSPLPVGRDGGDSVPLPRFTPVDMTVVADSDDRSFHRQLHSLAQDCVNQGGISTLDVINPPLDDA